MINIFLRLISILLVFAFLFGSSTKAVSAAVMSNIKSVSSGLTATHNITKTVTVTVNGKLVSSSYYYGTIVDKYSFNHNVGMTSGGGSVSVGENINFAYSPDIPYDNYSFNGLNGSIYGEIRATATAPLGISYLKSHGRLITQAGIFSHYFYGFSALPPVYMSSNNSGVVSCSGMSCVATGVGTAVVTANIGETPTVLEYDTIFSSDYYQSWVDTLYGKTLTWTITVSNPVVNGSCGSAQGSYVPTDTVWRAPFCSSGTPSPATLTFPTLGSTTSWQCIGSGTGHTDATCNATKNYANPTVTLTASPATITNINNNTLTPGTANTTLTWNITNQAQACGGLCTCDLTDVASGSTTSNIAYPITNSSTKTIGPGTHDYSVTCRNPQNNTGNDTETVIATCTPQTGSPACDKPCGSGNEIRPTLDTNCSSSNVSTGNSCNNGNCPVGSEFKEIAP